MNDELEIQHRQLIEEEDIITSQLPTEIKQAIRKFNMKLSKYEDTEDEKLYYELQHEDIEIADSILTYIEEINKAQDEEEEEEEEEEEIVPDTKSEPKPEVKEEPKNPILDVETMIRNTAKDGKISIDELEKILNREPDYPNEVIGRIIIKKQYLKPFYEVYEKG